MSSRPTVRKKRAPRASGKIATEQQRLLELALGMVCVGGLDGYLKRVNPSIRQVFGYSDEEMTSLPMIELIHPDDRSQSAVIFEAFAQGKPALGVETRVRTKDGTYRWVLWDAFPCLDQQLFLATGQDITQRKSVEAQLSESQERFQLIASATNEAVWDWDLRSDRVWRNHAYLEIFGAPDDQVDGTIEWWRQRVHPDDLERVLAMIPAPIIDGRQQWAMEYRLRRRDDTYAHVFDRGFVIFGRDGQPARMVGSILDVTRLVEAQQELRESEERFQLVAKATRDAIWDWDMRRGTVWRSEGFEALFGYDPQSVGSDLSWWVERTHPDDRERVCAQIMSLPTQGSRQCTIEYRFQRADGTYADVLERGHLIYDDDGKPVRMVGSLMDISDRRRAEELLSMQQAELARIARVRTMGEIATGLAHELNQPLAAIANYSESCLQAIASQKPQSQERLLEWIEKIAANTHRAGAIIRRLRGFTRRSEPRRSTVDVNELLRDVLELMDPENRRQSVRVQWQPAGVKHVVVDPVQIQQVLVNLLHNAAEAMACIPPEDRLVTVAAALDGDDVRISVADNGPGVPAGAGDRVFDAFYTTKPNGMGIGLAISRSIVEDHGGRLWVDATPRRGATFHFTLPVAERHDESPTQSNGRG